MGATVDAYKIAVEQEIGRWNGFDRALRKPDRETFDQLMDICRSYASESSAATNPRDFEPMVMSILLFQQKRIRKLEAELQTIIHETKPVMFSTVVFKYSFLGFFAVKRYVRNKKDIFLILQLTISLIKMSLNLVSLRHFH
jgi:hypothetical protein